MGGRGAKGLPTGHPNPGDGNSNREWSKAPDFGNFTSLKQAIGTKGKPMGIYQAAKGANPFFNGDSREFTENCQRAVIAYEARRRGYNVTAQPTFKGDILPRGAYGNNSYYMGAFQKAKTFSVNGTTPKTMQKNFENKIKGYGNNSRSTLAFGWKGSRQGHVINVEVLRGKIHYIDAQSGERYNPTELFKKIRVGTIRTTRTDNLRFSERAKKSIEPSRRRR